MFKFKRFLLVTLCLVMLASAALPAFAVTGYEVHDENLTYIGVRACCTSSLTLVKAHGKLVLSYLPAYANNQLPAHDYYCKVTLGLNYSDGGIVLPPDAASSGMQITNEFLHSEYRYGAYTCTKALFEYYVNGSLVHDESFE